MNGPDPIAILEEMRNAALRATVYIEGYEEADFLADSRTQQAVAMSFVIVGELAARAMRDYPDLVTAHPAIAWGAIRGFRNVIVHSYFKLDLPIMWITTRDSLPELIAQLEEAIALLTPPPEPT